MLLFVVLFVVVRPHKSTDLIVLGGLFSTITLLAILTVLLMEFAADKQTFTFVILRKVFKVQTSLWCCCLSSSPSFWSPVGRGELASQG